MYDEIVRECENQFNQKFVAILASINLRPWHLEGITFKKLTRFSLEILFSLQQSYGISLPASTTVLD